MVNILDVNEAVKFINDRDFVWVVGSGGGVNEPCKILSALEERYLKEQHPADLTLCHSSGIGNKCGGGSEHFAHRGMTRAVIGSHWTWSPKLQQMAINSEIEAYILPQGVMVQLAREIAARRPGLLTHVGLHTFIDPRVEGGAVNAVSKQELSEVLVTGGREYLFYYSFPVQVTILRATSADEDGNLSFEEEGVILEAISAAQAARNSGGIVLAQVKRVVKRGSIKPFEVRVPGILVDYLVVDRGQRQSFTTEYNPEYCGRYQSTSKEEKQPFLLTARKVIARRAAMELKRHDIVNLGFGIPAGVAAVIDEEGCREDIVLTIEQGIIGGVPADGSDFGLASNPMVILDEAYQFDWYDGGGLDVACLSFAEIDADGNVNVSRFGDKLIGVGGFINISQNAKTVLFMGTFTTKGLKESFHGNVEIEVEGQARKFVSKAGQISFSAQYARESGQKVFYITERAVFTLGEKGLVLIEKAPGIDLEKDILAHMDFTPEIAPKLKDMEAAVFKDDLLHLKKIWKLWR